MRCWLKSCPRCRATPLLETKEDGRSQIGCPQCGHVLSPREFRFLVEGMLPENIGPEIRTLSARRATR